MAVEKVKITVERLGKFGVLSGGLWYNLSSKSGLKISDFSPMTTYDILVYTSDGGKKYINQIVGTGSAAPKEIEMVSGTNPGLVKAGDDKLLEVLKEEAKRPVTVKADTSGYREVDWDKKNAQIRAQGTIQAAVESPAIQMFAANYDEWIALVEKTAKFELDFINKNS
jgi:hypothetical protein